MSENELIGTIYSYLLEEFGFGYIDKDLWMIAENLSEKIANEQPQLNENQQIVLEWLKEYMLDDSDFYNTVYASKQLYSYGVPYGEESEAFTKLNNRELAQVLELFSKWAQEQEEE